MAGGLTRRAFLAGAPLAAAGCASEPVWAPTADVTRSAYVHPGPPAITLFTTRNVGSGNGAHSGLMVNAGQRVLFDPAGTFGAPSLPERNDVIFGITPRVADYYRGYHARTSFYVVEQRLEVPATTAQLAFQLVTNYGAVAKAHCTRATSAVMQQLPGLEFIRRTWFPDNLERQFATVPGVVTSEHRETDADDRSDLTAQIAEGLAAQP